MLPKLLIKYKPGIPKRSLLLIAGFVWTTAGSILFIKGSVYLIRFCNYLTLRFIIGILFGIGFYLVLFAKISLKHILRICAIDIARPCIFSFFNFKSYFLMGFMITGGIMLRKFDVIEHDILFNFYVGMGTPLLISAARFYFAWFKYNEVVKTEITK
jgi:hypothetical protein